MDAVRQLGGDQDRLALFIPLAKSGLLGQPGSLSNNNALQPTGSAALDPTAALTPPLSPAVTHAPDVQPTPTGGVDSGLGVVATGVADGGGGSVDGGSGGGAGDGGSGSAGDGGAGAGSGDGGGGGSGDGGAV